MSDQLQLDNILAKLDVKRGMSLTRAIQNTRAYIDKQSDPQKVANGLLMKLGVEVPFIENIDKARIFVMTTVEQAVTQNNINPEQVVAKAEKSVEKLSQSGLLTKPASVTIGDKPKGKKGAKRAIAAQIYMENKDKPNKDIVFLVAEALGVTMANAYTYVYIVKKELA